MMWTWRTFMIEQGNKDTGTEQLTPASLPKAYEPQAVEARWYRFWEEGGYFKPRPNPSRKPFVISMPPPNVRAHFNWGTPSPRPMRIIWSGTIACAAMVRCGCPARITTASPRKTSGGLCWIKKEQNAMRAGG